MGPAGVFQWRWVDSNWLRVAPFTQWMSCMYLGEMTEVEFAERLLARKYEGVCIFEVVCGWADRLWCVLTA